jgi:hypothetical protein
MLYINDCQESMIVALTRLNDGCMIPLSVFERKAEDQPFGWSFCLEDVVRSISFGSLHTVVIQLIHLDIYRTISRVSKLSTSLSL